MTRRVEKLNTATRISSESKRLFWLSHLVYAARRAAVVIHIDRTMRMADGNNQQLTHEQLTLYF
jgi:hypothetical protein